MRRSGRTDCGERRAADAPWTRGRVQVYTGDGKGKTTAALGLALRAAGAGLRVFIAQFAKGQPSAEARALRRLAPAVTLRRFGRRRFITGAPSAADQAAARRGLAAARAAARSGRYRVVVMDEANVAVRLGLLRVEDVLGVIADRRPDVELVLTGRGAHPEVLRRADLVTQMRAAKHYYERGVRAREGIEL